MNTESVINNTNTYHAISNYNNYSNICSTSNRSKSFTNIESNVFGHNIINHNTTYPYTTNIIHRYTTINSNRGYSKSLEHYTINKNHKKKSIDSSRITFYKKQNYNLHNDKSPIDIFNEKESKLPIILKTIKISINPIIVLIQTI
ncbi:hypothetical protein EDEG_01352 [Edhazardia aedis USNM 41457]|uniref:Uncharacterized protein n=1 Tax=Edhazardia aedis (strain USNM 41457) TaxID=1003232 RepID=J9D9G6_EDHAE|nr:hypothetical protein EDEG_01352 [Edhazardia aedis USNM 41457]|eukprot:EJW04416.1 hypothetical protein EDEG_01352 [Edhazardia aedis USNM 41457]